MTEKNGPGQADKKVVEERTEQVAHDTAAEKVSAADAGSDEAEQVAVNPYPAYEEQSLAELRSAAKSRKVEINRDVEKAELVKGLRAKDPSLAYDLLPLEKLRSKAGELDVALPEEFEKAHLITELRAADTHTG